jgi:hypothetical protein
MSPTKRRHSKEEIAQRGDSIYQADVLPLVICIALAAAPNHILSWQSIPHKR